MLEETMPCILLPAGIAALIAQIQQYPELGKILSDVLAKQASTDENTENGNGNLSDSE